MFNLCVAKWNWLKNLMLKKSKVELFIVEYIDEALCRYAIEGDFVKDNEDETHMIMVVLKLFIFMVNCIKCRCVVEEVFHATF